MLIFKCNRKSLIDTPDIGDGEAENERPDHAQDEFEVSVDDV